MHRKTEVCNDCLKQQREILKILIKWRNVLIKTLNGNIADKFFN